MVPVLLAGVLCLAVWPLQAQTNDPAPAQTSPSTTPSDNQDPSVDPEPSDTQDSNDGRVVSSDQVKQELEASDNLSAIDALRAERAEYPRVSPEVRDKLREFKEQRDRYLMEQQELIKRFKGATEEERERIRNLLKDKRREWLERSRNIREDARRRLRDIIQELPKHREALEAARESAREEVKEIRTRPRTD